MVFFPGAVVIRTHLTHCKNLRVSLAIIIINVAVDDGVIHLGANICLEGVVGLQSKQGILSPVHWEGFV